MSAFTAQTLANCRAIAPELALIAALMAVLLVDLALLSRRSTGASVWVAVAGLGTAFALLTRFQPTDAVIFSGAIRLDSLALFFQKIFILGAMAVCLFTAANAEIFAEYRMGEYYALVLSATLGAMFLAAANDYIILVLSLETLSLSSYVLAGYLRVDRRSSEASMKYILYGAVASGVMLFGISYLYGMTGTLRIAETFAPLRQGTQSFTFFVAFALLLCGIGFKISSVPFHNWTPDVYEGSPTPISAFLAVVSKSAGFAILLRLVLQAGMAAPGFDVAAAARHLTASGLDIVFWILAAATMTVGNLVAIRQTDIKRLLGYSSIAHAGYLLMAFTVMNSAAWDAVLFYFVVYYLMTLGAFYVAITLEAQTGTTEMSACRGMWVASPYLVTAMVVFLISLTGLPPTAGFPAKLKLFKVLIDAALGTGMPRGPWFYLSLALIGVGNSVVSLYYYFKIVRAMTLERFETLPSIRLSVFDLAAMGALLVAVIFLGIYFQPVEEFVQTALSSLGGAARVVGGL
ncbi:MAG: NADH-quinone oxidoreductase subunit N [Candidatus Sumerlaeota bacterium]|nr:NADH-quinone oxidoreductase subunit N [Candidatus Sumerlaeota bacterium]